MQLSWWCWACSGIGRHCDLPTYLGEPPAAVGLRFVEHVGAVNDSDETDKDPVHENSAEHDLLLRKAHRPGNLYIHVSSNTCGVGGVHEDYEYCTRVVRRLLPFF